MTYHQVRAGLGNLTSSQRSWHFDGGSLGCGWLSRKKYIPSLLREQQAVWPVFEGIGVGVSLKRREWVAERGQSGTSPRLDLQSHLGCTPTSALEISLGRCDRRAGHPSSTHQQGCDPT